MQAIDQLVAQHHAFRSFVARRVRDEQSAEDILQSACAKTLERQHQIRNEESVVPWFYRVLRNTIADYYRRAAVDERRLRYDNDADFPLAAPQLQKTVCECVLVALDSLKSDYANAIRQVDVAGTAVRVFAQHEGTSSDNASVRLHRARKALTKQIIGTCGVCAEHKCIDCDCRPAHKRQL